MPISVQRSHTGHTEYTESRVSCSCSQWPLWLHQIALVLERSSAMISQHSMPLATRSRNRAGCPYLNQAGADAVLNWVSVLAGIDPATLPSELRAELGR